jgi:putative ABC transport system permease protein
LLAAACDVERGWQVLAVTFADLRYRYRQFLIAVVGAGLVFAMAVLLTGLADGFRAELDRTVGAVAADRWVVSDKSHGRLTAVSPFPASDVARIGREHGVHRSSGLAVLPVEVARSGSRTITVNVIGVVPGRLGTPVATSGTTLTHNGQAVVDTRAKVAIGRSIKVGSQTLQVVGLVKNRTFGGGMPVTYVSLHDAQLLGFGGQSLVTAVVTTGVPHQAPKGLQIDSSTLIERHSIQTLSAAVSSITSARTLMWVIATLIVSALIYVSALQRVRDFAVLKALGTSSGVLFWSLCVQAVIVTLLAAVFGGVLSRFMTGLFSQPLAIPGSAYITLPLVAIAVGVIASLAALRTATGADPVAAFGG